MRRNELFLILGGMLFVIIIGLALLQTALPATSKTSITSTSTSTIQQGVTTQTTTVATTSLSASTSIQQIPLIVAGGSSISTTIPQSPQPQGQDLGTQINNFIVNIWNGFFGLFSH